jgi:hypothetical protein
MPGGIKPYNTKEAALKDMYDEWLARIICFAFSISPQALVAQMNRATAEVAEETAKSSGLESTKNWLKGIMDRLIREVYGEPELEFSWVQKEAIKPEVQANIHSIYVNCGVMKPNEVREAIGLEALKEFDMPGPDPTVKDPLTVEPGEGQQEGPAETSASGLGQTAGPVQDSALSGIQVTSLLQVLKDVSDGWLPKSSATVVIRAAFHLPPDIASDMVEPIKAQEPGVVIDAEVVPPNEPEPEIKPEANSEPEPEAAPEPSEKIAKASGLKPIDRDRPSIKKIKDRLDKAIAKHFKGAKRAVIEKLKAELAKIAKGDPAPQGAGDIFASLFDSIPDSDFSDEFEKILRDAASDGAEAALKQIQEQLARDKKLFGPLFKQVNKRAAEWAKKHSAKMVTEINKTTRDGLRELIANGINEGMSVDGLAKNIARAHSFSKERAELIAVTELAEADVRGNKLLYAESGVVSGLQWQAANGVDGSVCPYCAENHNAIVPLNENGMAARPYPSGAAGVPAHPCCRCDEFPVLKGDTA